MNVIKNKHERQEVTIKSYATFTIDLISQEEKNALFKLLAKTNLNSSESIFTLDESEILYELYRQLAIKT